MLKYSIKYSKQNVLLLLRDCFLPQRCYLPKADIFDSNANNQIMLYNLFYNLYILTLNRIIRRYLYRST